MSWLLPGFLAGAALIGLPITLHFLRSKPKEFVRFPSLRFLGKTAVRDTRRHRLRRWITLLLRCLVIGVIAMAFARPFWTDTAAKRREAMVIAIDNSMSMQTAGRWEKTRQWAAQWLEALKPGDRAGLLLMNPMPSWLVPLTDDLASVRAALEAARPGYGKTRYGPPLETAAAALATTPAAKRTLVWMADEQRTGWLGVDLHRPMPGGVQVRLGETAPLPHRQAAIVKLQASAESRALSATVRQFAPETGRRELTVFAGGQAIATQAIDLRAGDNSVEIPLPKDADFVWLRVALDADDLPADDAAWIALDESAADKIFLDPAEGTDFVAHALRATRQLGAASFDPAPLPQGPWPAGRPVILRTAKAFSSPELDRFAGALWIFADGSTEQAAWLEKYGIRVSERSAPSAPWNLRDWDSGHPILAAYEGQSLLPLLNAEFYRGFDLSGEALVPLANWPDGKIALAEWSAGGRRALIAGFPLDREATNWPAQPSFVPFVHQAARWLADAPGGRQDWRVGEPVALPEGEGVWRAMDSPVPSEERRVSDSIRPAAPGIFEFSAGGLRRLYAVNPPAEESDLAPWPNPDQLLALESAPSAPVEIPRSLPLNSEASESQQRLWWWLLALCAVAILAELALANRTAV